jgi:leucine dehydrogenase
MSSLLRDDIDPCDGGRAAARVRQQRHHRRACTCYQVDRLPSLQKELDMNDFHVWDSEQVVTCRDDAIGLRAVIAIDDTTLGGGLGGVRLRTYTSYEAGIVEAQRLAAAMTLKNALAQLPYGGAKSVIFAEGDPALRDARMYRFGEFVAQLAGRYLPGVDMGTTTADLLAMARAGAPATCSEEDPSPWTALGVFEALRSAVGFVDRRNDLRGVSVAIQGVGHVGAELARLLAEADAQVIVSDVDQDVADAVARNVGGSTVAPAAVVATACDVFAPCATARVLTPESIATLGARMVVGGANDTLQDASCADLLLQAGVTYVPDFLANAGGVVHIHALREGWDITRIGDEVRRIGERTSNVLVEAAQRGITPVAAAEARARRRIADLRTAIKA